jgi:hypothetical protein
VAPLGKIVSDDTEAIWVEMVAQHLQLPRLLLKVSEYQQINYQILLEKLLPYVQFIS